jgi:hypothetical protein
LKLVRKNVGSTLLSAYANSNFIQKYTTAVIHEAIRMFPPVMRLGRKVYKDTCVQAKIFDSHSLEVLQKVDVPIRAGSDVILDVLGLHMNRRSFTPNFF